MFCIPFNNLTVLTGLAVLMESSLIRLIHDDVTRRDARGGFWSWYVHSMPLHFVYMQLHIKLVYLSVV
jgi:hypothetical protein